MSAQLPALEEKPLLIWGGDEGQRLKVSPHPTDDKSSCQMQHQLVSGRR